MNKKTFITILIALVAVAGQGQVRCHVIGTVAEGTTPIELRIYRDGEDPKNSTLRPVLKNGRFECDVEDAQIERWHIVDFGEVMEKGMTLRTGEFFVEDHPARRRQIRHPIHRQGVSGVARYGASRRSKVSSCL